MDAIESLDHMQSYAILNLTDGQICHCVRVRFVMD